MAGKKLVRDKIPELFNLTDNYIADDEEYYKALISKLKEEANEYAHDQEMSELADVLEVVRAIAKFKGSSIEEVEKIREEKFAKRGGFDKKIIWTGDQRADDKDMIRLNANAIVTNPEGKFLIVRLKKGPFKGGLCIPGGGVMPGELADEAAKREVLEETGINVTEKFKVCGFCELKHNASGKQKVVMLLHAYAEGEPKNTDEGEAMWMSYEEAKPELIIFADEAIKMWRDGRTHFRIVNEKVV